MEVSRMVTWARPKADVLAGHYERKLKHLENQKEAKKRMKRVGTVNLPQEAFYDLMSSKGS